MSIRGQCQLQRWTYLLRGLGLRRGLRELVGAGLDGGDRCGRDFDPQPPAQPQPTGDISWAFGQCVVPQSRQQLRVLATTRSPPLPRAVCIHSRPQSRESASLDTHGASEAEGSSLSSTGFGLSCASRAITAARAVASRAAFALCVTHGSQHESAHHSSTDS